MAVPFLDSLKNFVPSLEKATEVTYVLLLSSFVLTADCAALYAHGMNIFHLSDVPDIIKPRLAIEAVILVIVFGIIMSLVMPFVMVFANFVVLEIVGRAWDYIAVRLDPNGNPQHTNYSSWVSIHALERKAHETKENYYLNLLKDAKEKEIEHSCKIEQTALLALGTLTLSGINLYAHLSSEGECILAQIAEALGYTGYIWLLMLGCMLVTLAFYPLFTERRATVYCPDLASELDEERRRRMNT